MDGLPRWPWSHWARAWSKLCRGDAENALMALNEALREAPDFSEANELKARLLLDLGRYVELGRLLQPLINKEHNRSFAYTMLANSLLAQNKPSLAVDVAETAVKFDWTNVDGFVALGRARLGVGDVAGAQRAFHNASKLDGDNPRVKAAAALADASGPQLQRTLAELARQWPGNTEIWCWLAHVSEHGGDTGQATEAYEAALAAKPYLLEAQTGLASLQRKAKRV
jgi:cytochrome c-type biogenesis protein CcmH/NrfG